MQANAFAAELLAPAAGVVAMVDGAEPGLEDVVRLAAHFGISTIAALYRLNSLGLCGHYEELVTAIAKEEHEAVWERLDVAPKLDGIAGIDLSDLPRLSPSLLRSALAAVAGGRASMVSAAEASGCDAGSMASGAASIGI